MIEANKLLTKFEENQAHINTATNVTSVSKIPLQASNQSLTFPTFSDTERRQPSTPSTKFHEQKPQITCFHMLDTQFST